MAAWAAAAGSLLARADSQTPERSPRPWSPEIAEALVAYQSGNYAVAQRECGVLLEKRGAGRWRIDAAALDALCALRAPSRTERIEGRARLKQLVEQDPTLETEPECQLAFGLAETALNETSLALEALEQAAHQFARENATARLPETLVALAEAWARHAEWETTPPRFRLRPPPDRAAAAAIRRHQIEQLRARIESLPKHEEALAQLDLILARHLLETDSERERGLQVLAQLAGKPVWHAANAEAAGDLAGHLERNARFAEALPLYARLQEHGSGELSRRAEQRILDITRPQIDLSAPPSVPTGQTIPIGLRVRGLQTARLEIRGVNVDAWLGSAATRGSEASLPETGALRVAWEFDPRVSVPHAWWDVGDAQGPLEFAAPPGAYAVIATGTTDDGRTVKTKRLLVVSDLTVVAAVGPRCAVLWSPAAADGTASDDPTPMEAHFWMNRSFAATPVEFHAGVARFPLPNEAQVLRERGWVCLVRRGEHVAVCRGQLPLVTPGDLALRVLLLAGPPAPLVGDPVHVAGFLLPSAGGDLRLADGATLELRTADVMENVSTQIEAPLSSGGGFSAQFPIWPSQLGQPLRILPRFRGQVLDNVLLRPHIRVSSADAADLYVEIEPDLQISAGGLRGVVRALYPWGLVPHGACVRCEFSTVATKPATADESCPHAAPIVREGRLDDHGQWAFDVPRPDPQWTALRVTATVQGWEGRSSAVARQFALPTNDVPGNEPQTQTQPVASNAAAAQPPPPVRCTAQFTQAGSRNGVRVQLDGRVDMPLLVAVVGRDPVAACALPGLAGPRELDLALDTEPPNEARVWLVRATASGGEMIGAEPVQLAATTAPRLHVSCTNAEIWPGIAAHVVLDYPSPPPRTVIAARLVSAEDFARADPVVLPPRPRGAASSPLLTASGTVSTAATSADLDDDSRWAAWTAGLTLWCWSGAATGDRLELAVPMPPTPGLYTLQVAVHTPGRGLVTQALALDARHGWRLAVDCPERLTLGDRTRVTVRVENASRHAAEATLHVAGGVGLAPERWHLVAGHAAREGPGDQQPLQFTLAAGEQAVATIDVEAARSGSDRLVCELTARGIQRELARGYKVDLVSASAPAAGAVVLRRTVLLCSQRPESADHTATHMTQLRSDDQTVLPAGATVTAGRCLHVREEFTLTKRFADVNWVQPVPPNCRPLAREISPRSVLTVRKPDEPGAVVFDIAELEPGTYAQDYFLVVLRPGACLLAAPSVHAGVVTVPVRVEPEEIRIIVLATE